MSPCVSHCVAIQKKGCMLIRKLSDENLIMQDVSLESLANTVIDAMLHRRSDPDVQVEVIPSCVCTYVHACMCLCVYVHTCMRMHFASVCVTVCIIVHVTLQGLSCVLKLCTVSDEIAGHFVTSGIHNLVLTILQQVEQEIMPLQEEEDEQTISDKHCK